MRPRCACHHQPMILKGSGQYRCKVKLAEYRDTEEFRARERRRNGRREVQRRKKRMGAKSQRINQILADLVNPEA